jgi:Ni,Fe-hydrogenase III small subunit
MDLTYKQSVAYPAAPIVLPTRPEITDEKVDAIALKKICPTGAIGANPVRIDLGKCIFCKACSQAFPDKIKFTTDQNVVTNVRDRLIILEGDKNPVAFDKSQVRDELRHFGGDIRLFDIGAFLRSGHDDDISKASTANMSHAGISFVKLPSDANGMLISGEVSQNMEDVLLHCYEGLASPRLIVVAGNEAINSDIFLNAIGNANIASKISPDVYVPGLHPNSIASGIIQLLKQ